MTPHMYVLNHIVVPLLAWYLRIRIGWGTGRSPTRVPCCRNFRISDSSVRPLYTWCTVITIITSTTHTQTHTSLFRTSAWQLHRADIRWHKINTIINTLKNKSQDGQQEVKVIWQKAPHGGPIPRLGVTPGGRKLYHWIPGVGFPISVP